MYAKTWLFWDRSIAFLIPNSFSLMLLGVIDNVCFVYSDDDLAVKQKTNHSNSKLIKFCFFFGFSAFLHQKRWLICTQRLKRQLLSHTESKLETLLKDDLNIGQTMTILINYDVCRFDYHAWPAQRNRLDLLYSIIWMYFLFAAAAWLWNNLNSWKFP